MTKEEAMKYLASLGIRFDERIILIPKGLRLGIRRWAYVDYLINHQGFYGWMWGSK